MTARKNQEIRASGIGLADGLTVRIPGTETTMHTAEKNRIPGMGIRPMVRGLKNPMGEIPITDGGIRAASDRHSDIRGKKQSRQTMPGLFFRPLCWYNGRVEKGCPYEG